MRDEIQNSQMSPLAVIEKWASTIKNKSNIKCNFFDDLLLEKKKNKCECYYICGRHSNVDCFYLSQSYFTLPRQTIRENANFFNKILKTLITSMVIMWARICRRKSLENFVSSVGKNCTVSLSSI